MSKPIKYLRSKQNELRKKLQEFSQEEYGQGEFGFLGRCGNIHRVNVNTSPVEGVGIKPGDFLILMNPYRPHPELLICVGFGKECDACKPGVKDAIWFLKRGEVGLSCFSVTTLDELKNEFESKVGGTVTLLAA